MMKRILPLIGVASVLALAAGCADYGYGNQYGNGGGYGAGYGYNYGPAPVGYDGYYDDYYGPFYDGYWAADGAFYFRSGDNDRFRRDTAGHFRHEAVQGFHPVRGHPRDSAAAPRQSPDRDNNRDRNGY